MRALHRQAGGTQIGTLVALLGLARVEYGVAATLAAILLHLPNSPKWHIQASQCARAIAIAATAWIVAALALKVWPIPTTYLSKIVSGDMRQFGPPFIRTFAETLSHYLPLPSGRNAARTVTAIGCLCIGLILARRTAASRVLLCTLAVVFALIANGPGNFMWYHENLLVAAIAGLLALTTTSPPHRQPHIEAIALSVLLSLLSLQRLGRNDRLAWDLRTPDTYGYSLVELAKCHSGHGTWQLPGHGTSPTQRVYIATAEIGILAFFSGHDSWLYDSSGLAQAGHLPAAKEHWLSVFYPDAALTTPSKELDSIASNDDRPQQVMQIMRLQPANLDAFRIRGTTLFAAPRNN